jgi:hypothetical protein
MSKKSYTTSDKKKQRQNSSRSETGESEKWQAAINFATQKVDQLKTLIKIFGEYRDTDHPFPGDVQPEKLPDKILATSRKE